jgi:uncharacterized membrane protein YdjX (TVP38/TMEM64 family)
MDFVFARLMIRRTILVVVPLLVLAAIAWALFGVWGWFVVLVVGSAAMAARGITILRRARG